MAAVIPTAKLMQFVQCCIVVLNTNPTAPPCQFSNRAGLDSWYAK